MNDHSHNAAVQKLVRTANLQHQIDRRTAILDAAEQCFMRSGFHQTSMSDICQAAGMSPGNLYRYFPSKEALIAGITERHRASVAADFAGVEGAPSFFEGLAVLARRHLVESSIEEVGLSVEILAESRRNPAIAKLFHDLEDDVKLRLIALLKFAAARGEISPTIDFEGAATMLVAIADGISMRRLADRNFDSERALPLMFQIVEGLLGKPVAPGETSQGTKS